MRKVERLLAEAGQLGAEAEGVCRRLSEHYEHELSAMTAHMGQMYEELMLLYAMGDEIAETLDASVIADRAVARIGELLDAGGGQVFLATPDSPSDERELGSSPLPSGAGAVARWAARQVAERDRGLILNDLSESEVPASGSVTNLLACPLRARGRLIGAVTVIDKAVAGGFTTEDQMLLQAISSQLGAAIESSRLFRAEQEHARHLAAALDELGSTYDDTLEALSGALDLRDNETEGHARRVTRYSVRISQALGIGGAKLIDIERGALLHDIGKIGVPDSILLKPAKLTDEEWVVMKRHPVLGHQMIRNIRFLSGGAPVVLHHHERFDGRGYPAGLGGREIPLGALVFAVADTFDAMTSDRPYRRALDYDVALAEIRACSRAQFDPEVVEAFAAVEPAEWETIRVQVEEVIASRRRDHVKA